MDNQTLLEWIMTKNDCSIESAIEWVIDSYVELAKHNELSIYKEQL